MNIVNFKIYRSSLISLAGILKQKFTTSELVESMLYRQTHLLRGTEKYICVNGMVRFSYHGAYERHRKEMKKVAGRTGHSERAGRNDRYAVRAKRFKECISTVVVQNECRRNDIAWGLFRYGIRFPPVIHKVHRVQ